MPTERQNRDKELCVCGAAASSMEGGNASCERMLFAEKEQVMALLQQMASPDCLAEGMHTGTSAASLDDYCAVLPVCDRRVTWEVARLFEDGATNSITLCTGDCKRESGRCCCSWIRFICVLQPAALLSFLASTAAAHTRSSFWKRPNGRTFEPVFFFLKRRHLQYSSISIYSSLTRI